MKIFGKIKRKVSIVLIITMLFTLQVNAADRGHLTNSNPYCVGIPLDPGTAESIIEELIALVGTIGALLALQTVSQDQAIDIAEAKRRKIVPIFRMGNHTYNNCTPRPGIDRTGLSFNLHPPVGQKKFLMSSMQAVNATPHLNAWVDNRITGHVTVYPYFYPMMYGAWVASKPTAEENPFILTRELYAVCTVVRTK